MSEGIFFVSLRLSNHEWKLSEKSPNLVAKIIRISYNDVIQPDKDHLSLVYRHSHSQPV